MKINQHEKFLHYILHTPCLSTQSVYYSRGVKFFSLHPTALPIFINNLSLSTRIICNNLLSAGVVSPRGVSYSPATISAVKQFLVDILNFVNLDDFK